ncbi:MAG: hypothetical protein N2050_07235 [Flavobacteriales bacterium]|nr:hypothetical protein [Flavobacteriales bacterium]MCX7650328.1 hypothetical protein [Flavobacteriales bacterium]MDW8432100.1 hypothetical protein [Flavobacteriales bacterium]
MNKTVLDLKYAAAVLAALFFEFFVLPRIQLGFYFSVHVYFYLLIHVSVNIEKHLALLAAFTLGLIVDQGLNTGGLHAASAVTAMYLRPIFIRAFGPREGYGKPDYLTVFKFGFANYLLYILSMVFVHQFVLIVLESFSVAGFTTIVLRVAGGTLATVGLYVALHLLTVRRAPAV